MRRIKSLLTTTNVIATLLAIVGVYVLFPTYYEMNIFSLPAGGDPFASLDNSWGVGLNYVKIHNLVWGIDNAFTYGPLSQLCTRIGWGESHYTFLLFDLFMAVNYFCIFFFAYRESKNKIVAAIVILAAIILFPFWVSSAYAIILMLVLIFWIRKSLDYPRWVYYALQIAIITLLFFIKFNTGFIAYPLFLAGIAYNWITKNGRRALLAGYAVLPIILIVILSFPLNVSLLAYMHSGFEIVSGYNDAMHFPNANPDSFTLVGLLAFLLIVVLFFNLAGKGKKPWLRIAVVFFLSGTAFFVMYKQGFVRADSGHLHDFFIFVPLLMLCVPDVYRNFPRKWVIVPLLLALYVPYHFTLVTAKGTLDINNRLSKKDYINRCVNFSSMSGMFAFQQNNSPIPPEMRSKIKNKTVDVFPWNIQLLLENNLKYSPRPVFQSYSAYTAYLEDLNFAHYNNVNTAPEFVIYDYFTIDNRYALFDEPKLSLALYKNYMVAGVYDFQGRQLILLQKKPDFVPIKLVKGRQYTVNNAPIPVAPDVFYQLEVSENWKGKAVSVLHHSPVVIIGITKTDGTSEFRNTSKMLLQSGIFADSFVGDTEHAAKFFGHTAAHDVKSYGIFFEKPEFFNQNITVTEYKIIQ